MTTQQYKLIPFRLGEKYFAGFIFVIEGDWRKFFHYENSQFTVYGHSPTLKFRACEVPPSPSFYSFWRWSLTINIDTYPSLAYLSLYYIPQSSPYIGGFCLWLFICAAPLPVFFFIPVSWDGHWQHHCQLENMTKHVTQHALCGSIMFHLCVTQLKLLSLCIFLWILYRHMAW